MSASIASISRRLPGFVVAWLLLLAAMLLGLHSYLESNSFRHFVEAKLSHKLQTPVTLEQNLGVSFGWPVRITLHGMHISNPDWAVNSDFMRINTLVVTAHFQHLLQARLGLDIQQLAGGRIKLVRGPKGQLNVPHPAPPGRLIYLHSLAGAVVKDVTLENAAGKLASVRRLKVLSGEAGGRLVLDVNGRLGSRSLQAKLGVPGLKYSRHEDKDKALHFKIDSLTWGKSDLTGQLTLDLSEPSPTMHATLHSRKWLLPSPATGQTQAAGKNTGNPFPAVPIPTFWRELKNSGIDLKVDRLVAGGVNADNLHARLRIDNATLHIDPLTADISKGAINMQLTLDAGKQPAAISLDGSLKHLDLSGAIGPLLSGNSTRGHVNAGFNLRSAADNTRSVLGNLNGQLRLVMEDGELSNALLNRMALNLGHLLSLQSKGERGARIRCLVIEASARDGVVKLGQTLADTERLLLVGDGEIDLRSGQVNVSLNPSSTSVSEVGIPIDIHGPLTHPKGQIDKTATVAKAATALVSGVLGAPGKLTDLIGLTGGSDNSGCRATLKKYAH